MEINHAKHYKDKGKDCKTSSSHCSEEFYRISSLSINFTMVIFRPTRDGFSANVQVKTWILEWNHHGNTVTPLPP